MIGLKMIAAGLTALGLLTAGVKVTLSAPTHTPGINVRWPYAVRAERAGVPVSARLTAQIVDPLGGVHPVEFGKSRKHVTNWPFKGVFRDYIIWPSSSRGVPLTFRITVRTATAKRVVDYHVTPHG